MNGQPQFVEEHGTLRISAHVVDAYYVECSSSPDADCYGMYLECRSVRMQRLKSTEPSLAWRARSKAEVLELIRTLNRFAGIRDVPDSDAIQRLERKARLKTGSRQKALYRRANRLRRKATSH